MSTAKPKPKSVIKGLAAAAGVIIGGYILACSASYLFGGDAGEHCVRHYGCKGAYLSALCYRGDPGAPYCAATCQRDEDCAGARCVPHDQFEDESVCARGGEPAP